MVDFDHAKSRRPIKASDKKNCPCRMGTLARPGFKTEIRTGKGAHPTPQYDNSRRSPNVVPNV